MEEPGKTGRAIPFLLLKHVAAADFKIGHLVRFPRAAKKALARAGLVRRTGLCRHGLPGMAVKKKIEHTITIPVLPDFGRHIAPGKRRLTKQGADLFFIKADHFLRRVNKMAADLFRRAPGEKITWGVFPPLALPRAR